MPGIAKQIIRIFFFLLIIGCNSLYAQEKATPKNGEGLNAFLQRNKRPGTTYRKEFIELNKKKLGKNNTLILGVQYSLPPLKDQTSKPTNTSSTTTNASSTQKKKGKEPLFGQALAEYEIVSNELAGATFYVVSGHGGPDPGAIGKMGNYVLHEDEYAYDIALRLARNLLMRGAKVHIIIQDALDGIRDEQILKNSKRETCMGSEIPLNQIARLNQRCEKINALEKNNKPAYSRSIFIHIDSRSKHKRTDVYFFHSDSKASKWLSNTMKDTFTEKYRQSQPSRGFSGYVEQRNLHVLNKSTPVALFVELGNIQNSFDQQRFILSNNRQALANWLCDGFITDYNKNKPR